MKKLPRAVYATPDELQVKIAEFERLAAQLPDGSDRQQALIELSKLRAYADMKRWVAASAKARKPEHLVG